MLPSGSPKETKVAMFSVFGGYVGVTLLLYIFVGAKNSGDATLAEMAPSYALAIGSFLTCAVLSHLKLRLVAEFGEVPSPPTPQLFQSNMILACAFAELSCLTGIFMRPGFRGSAAPAVVLSLVGLLGLVLPRVLAYWRAVDAQGE